MLKLVNPFLYEPGQFLGWYPPVVSPNQVRGTWTEPAYFAIWLAMAVPFLIHRLFEKTQITPSGWLWRGGLLFWLFVVWSMTYARTSVVLIVPMAALYVIFALVFRARRSMQVAGLLLAAVAAGFLWVSQWGPQDIGRWTSRTASSVSVEVTKSSFIENTVKSSVNVESRSTPTRLQGLVSKLGVFWEHPWLGAGDAFAPWRQMEWLLRNPAQLTGEMRDRIRYTQEDGIFKSGLGGNSLSASAFLAGRGIVGFAAFLLPLLATGVALLASLRHQDAALRRVGVTLFIACAVTFPSIVSQGLWFFYFWCAFGLALGFVVDRRRKLRQDGL